MPFIRVKNFPKLDWSAKFRRSEMAARLSSVVCRSHDASMSNIWLMWSMTVRPSIWVRRWLTIWHRSKHWATSLSR